MIQHECDHVKNIFKFTFQCYGTQSYSINIYDVNHAITYELHYELHVENKLIVWEKKSCEKIRSHKTIKKLHGI